MPVYTIISLLFDSLTMLSWICIVLNMLSTHPCRHTNQTTSVTMLSTSVTALMESRSADVYQSSGAVCRYAGRGQNASGDLCDNAAQQHCVQQPLEAILHTGHRGRALCRQCVQQHSRLVLHIR